MGLKAALNSMMRPPERKLFAAGMTALAISAGFVFVVFKVDAKANARDVLDAYKTACEWLVYLFAAFAGGNALTWWSQRGQAQAEHKPNATPTTPAGPAPVK
jgi:hypothetical protein